MRQQKLALYAPGGVGMPGNLFGKDVANLELYRALCRHAGLDAVTMLMPNQVQPAELAAALFPGEAAPLTLQAGSLLSVARMAEAGTVLRGKADLSDLAWMRREAGGDRAFSLVGLVHCIAPPALRRYIADAATAPVQSWDALICTSPVVRDNLRAMFEELTAYLGARFGAPSPVPRMPALPVIPLGVDADRLAGLADRPAVRQAVRARLGLADDDVLVLWVGRLSFFEKAFPQPMFKAVEQARQRSGKRLVFALAGWFPAPDDRRHFQEAASAHAPSVPIHFLDGRDAELVGGLWAGADIFLSLVDNIQETFGLTPLEAMAAGLPVVVSDWDGYRATVEDGVQGFRVRTLSGPGGLGSLMLQRHQSGVDGYQAYVGAVAQHTAVDVEAAADALARLAADPALRRRMGAAGRQRVRTSFDWPVVVGQMAALFEDCAQRRREAGSFETPAGEAFREDPVRGEPFACFTDFASEVLGDDTRLSRVPGAEAGRRLAPVGLDQFGAMWRVSGPEIDRILSRLEAEGACRTATILSWFPAERRKAVQATLMWLCKLAILRWENGDQEG